MSQPVRIGIAGLGWPGMAYGSGCQAAGGFRVVAVADLIPRRRQAAAEKFGQVRQHIDASELVADEEVDAIGLCLPTHLHAAVAVAALKAGKHVLCEPPPGLSAREAKQIESAAAKAGKVVLYGLQRRYGSGELAARQAIAKGFVGEAYHVRASWMRTRGVPVGTGWYGQKEQSGGGAMIDLGLHMLDLGWHLLGQPRPERVYGVVQRRLGVEGDVEDAGFALVRFEGGKTLELAASWAINQAPGQQGTICRVYGQEGGIEVYTPQGAVVYRNFSAKGESKATPLKPPKVIHHAALLRHFRQCILGQAEPAPGAGEGLVLMRLVEAIYRSAETGKALPVDS